MNDVASQNRTEADAILEAGAATAASPRLFERGRQVVVRPPGHELELLNVPGPIPEFLTGTVHHVTLDSFSAYVTRFVKEATTVWVAHDKPDAVAVLDDHDLDVAQWGAHRANLHLDFTDEWKHWTGKNDRPMDQMEFAEHIEDGRRQIIEPDAATVREIAGSLQARNDVSFRQAVRLDNGQVQINYSEEITATAGTSGTLEIPQRIVLGIPPYLGCAPYKIEAQFRYRIREGKLSLAYKLDQPDAVLRDALNDIATTLSDSFDRVYRGTPRAEELRQIERQ